MKRILCLWGEQWCRSSINMCYSMRYVMINKCAWIQRIYIPVCVRLEWVRWSTLSPRWCVCVCVRTLLREVNVMQFFVIFMLLLTKTLQLVGFMRWTGDAEIEYTHYISENWEVKYKLRAAYQKNFVIFCLVVKCLSPQHAHEIYECSASALYALDMSSKTYSKSFTVR